jgi:uncharacterized damage-inducible protein DinB
MKPAFTMFAAYNRWANRRLYAAVAELPEADYRADRGVFFRSLEGTLNHLLVTERIWMRRFSGEGPTYGRLDLILHDRLDDLRAAREAEDERIRGWIEGRGEADLAATFTYTPITDPRPVTQPLAPALFHMFNHQTHHRGQAHAVLTGLGRDAPALDLVTFQRETGIGLAA